MLKESRQTGQRGEGRERRRRNERRRKRGGRRGGGPVACINCPDPCTLSRRGHGGDDNGERGFSWSGHRISRRNEGVAGFGEIKEMKLLYKAIV